MTYDTDQLASFTLEFLRRVTLQGAEVPAFVEVSNWLNGIIDGNKEKAASVGTADSSPPAG